MMKKIAYISGNRADFGLMTPILQAIQKSKKLELRLYTTGTHFMPEFGGTINIVKKLFPNVKEIPVAFESDDRKGMAKFAAQFLGKLIPVLVKDKPDIVFAPCDRVEMLTAAMAALYLGIPVAHIHGGEKTSTVDELARHAITKIAHIHFAATKESAERIKKMGEDKWRIHIVGAPVLDVILNEKLPSRAELYKKLNLDPKEKIILVTQHPVSEAWKDAGRQITKTFSAVKSFGLPIVVAYPNADAGGRKIIEVIKREKKNPQFRIFPHLQHEDFLALEREAAVWVGNSSAGMIESSSFKTPVVNVGARQLGRQHGDNVINVGYDRDEIKKAVDKSLNNKIYLAGLKKIKNPWGDGKTGPRVAKILENVELVPKLLAKQITY
ncbi:MAG: UDP-N-acetyl-D-glucosamine 2-epimerase, UDP-hydrolysing [Candidatus Giovannonibacteria bacterium GW2011_GWA1_43_15]|uniref:UDP-N-acetyl-D-glucosamine 2-epimerase, UDP-hydrolysing n=1 Tax=Candidatus Giovannonibacteria bacterium GW2011_GWA2_44_26 TaxID=1618648 RepID=A0A0G1IWT1_9BACT|nr:MAG: UDP-N-acetyl-D-glucosamine 2-epimerase, UDP-hydrolysing [Candidatus Giovannonibacteria bacterium GW2011_GWB1_43_13]KKS99565.1 MAG: UDP-N-acetyl-D-glucosamine 2-epimerase, UDP-hydrolysing [Candidatus Giovannonibacteria bacterium GW2011_GWA1_43_15]KKT21642.1 MAG: UDP-N-acetyl-D-glucosamine 2-epimerase, UDP-hydrolysing [Candidatus Giovannonibacteria bacterium GW2011_GWC2_43_8]KKT63448.1 MAG: UDP-N-acetyl-D-glucosamine 2-epimerase, UDP-hydrolysing [Candidatus Giovannonibacteria bacterium GW2